MASGTNATSETATVFGKADLHGMLAIAMEEHWLIDKKQVNFDSSRRLGRGGFGEVVSGSLCGTPVAVKLAKDEMSALSVASELRILRRLRHPSIVLFHGIILYGSLRNRQIGLVLELVDGEDLSEFIRKQAGVLNTLGRVCIVADLCSALWYLHSNSPCIVHGDVKPRNAMIHSWDVFSLSKPRVKLIDFGLSRILSAKGVKPLGGTFQWMSPEVLIHEGMTPLPSADVFSLGRLIFFVMTGLHPCKLSKHELLEHAIAQKVPPLPWPEQAPLLKECRAICDSSIAFEASGRPDIAWIYGCVSRWGDLVSDSTPSPTTKLSRQRCCVHAL